MNSINPDTQSSQDVLKDSRRHSFFIIDNEIIEDERITKADFMVYSVLLYHAGKGGDCWPGINTICKESRCCKPIVENAIRHIELLGYIRIENRKRADGGDDTHLYTILPVSKVDREGGGKEINPGGGKEMHPKQYSVKQDQVLSIPPTASPLTLFFTSLSNKQKNALKKAERTSENTIEEVFNFMQRYRETKYVKDRFAFMYKALTEDWGLNGNPEDWGNYQYLKEYRGTYADN